MKIRDLLQGLGVFCMLAAGGAGNIFTALLLISIAFPLVYFTGGFRGEER